MPRLKACSVFRLVLIYLRRYSMNQEERERRSHDFFSTLPPELQNRIAIQKKLTAENKAPQNPPIPDKYRFTSWFD